MLFAPYCLIAKPITTKLMVMTCDDDHVISNLLHPYSKTNFVYPQVHNSADFRHMIFNLSHKFYSIWNYRCLLTLRGELLYDVLPRRACSGTKMHRVQHLCMMRMCQRILKEPTVIFIHAWNCIGISTQYLENISSMQTRTMWRKMMHYWVYKMVSQQRRCNLQTCIWVM